MAERTQGQNLDIAEEHLIEGSKATSATGLFLIALLTTTAGVNGLVEARLASSSTNSVPYLGLAIAILPFIFVYGSRAINHFQTARKIYQERRQKREIKH